MARNIIKLAGGSYTRLKALSGSEQLQGREVVISTDTHELYVGNGDGSFDLLGNILFGSKEDESIYPQRGRLLFDTEKSLLFIGTGSEWKKIGVDYSSSKGLNYNEETGEVEIKVDDESIVFNPEGELSVQNTDYGEF